MLRSGHLQTIAPSFLPLGSDEGEPVYHVVDLRDGDQVAVVENRPSTESTTHAALLVPGMCSSHRSGYIIRTKNSLLAAGNDVFRIDMRGFGASELISKGSSHAGAVDDLHDVICWLIDEHEVTSISLVGFSLGANLLLLYLGRHAMEVPKQVTSALAIAPPIDLERCSLNLRHGLNRFYDWNFSRTLKQQIYRRRRQVAGLRDVPRKRIPSRLWHIDDQIVAPLAGYSGAKEYYSACSSKPWLSDISVPTRLVAAANDPLIPISMFDEIDSNAALELIVTPGGGHLGYVNGSFSRRENWLSQAVARWITSA